MARAIWGRRRGWTGFAREREAASAGKYVPENPAVTLFSKGGDTVIKKKVTVWKMKPIYAAK